MIGDKLVITNYHREAAAKILPAVRRRLAIANSYVTVSIGGESGSIDFYCATTPGEPFLDSDRPFTLIVSALDDSGKADGSPDTIKFGVNFEPEILGIDHLGEPGQALDDRLPFHDTKLVHALHDLYLNRGRGILAKLLPGFFQFDGNDAPVR